jgi:hypothetical protein
MSVALLDTVSRFEDKLQTRGQACSIAFFMWRSCSITRPLAAPQRILDSLVEAVLLSIEEGKTLIQLYEIPAIPQVSGA